MFILKGTLRAESQEKILLYLLARERGYGKAIAEFFGVSQNAVNKQLIRLEEDGVIVSRTIGKQKEYELNPRYPFLPELTALLQKALSAYPTDLVASLSINRTRPRKSGKTLLAAEGNKEKNQAQ